jgi:hypothetical protein
LLLAAATTPLREKKQLKCGNHWYHLSRLSQTKDGPTAYYRCQFYRATKQRVACKGTLQVLVSSTEIISMTPGKEPHNCGTDAAAQPKRTPLATIPVNCIPNVAEEMKRKATELYENDPSLKPKFIAKHVVDLINEKYQGKPNLIQTLVFLIFYLDSAVSALNTNQIEKFIYNQKARDYTDKTLLIRAPEFSLLPDGQPFLQAHSYVRIGTRYDEFVCWAHPQLLPLVSYRQLNVFVDCTFKVCPVGFSQCMVVMVFDLPSCLYIPVFYVLLNGKSVDHYLHALNMIIYSNDWNFDAKTVTCDFEQALMSAIRSNFPTDPAKTDDPCCLIGCLFHWKQAIRRKLESLGLEERSITKLMGPKGLINLLTVVDPNEIIYKTIPYIRDHFEDYNDSSTTALFDQFWNHYFTETWYKKYEWKTWNVHHIITNPLLRGIVINRTNNPLERFNKKFGDSFNVNHASLEDFIQTVKSISEEYVKDRDRILRHQMNPPERRLEPAYFPIPAD